MKASLSLMVNASTKQIGMCMELDIFFWEHLFYTDKQKEEDDASLIILLVLPMPGQLSHLFPPFQVAQHFPVNYKLVI